MSVPYAVPIGDVASVLPDGLQIRAVVVEFEPGRRGRLILEQPSRSAEEIVQDAIVAQEQLHTELIKYLSQGGLRLSGPATEDQRHARELEIEHLKRLESKKITPTTLYVTDVFVDGPHAEIEALAIALGGSTP